jgi:hypothetical protein
VTHVVPALSTCAASTARLDAMRLCSAMRDLRESDGGHRISDASVVCAAGCRERERRLRVGLDRVHFELEGPQARTNHNAI